MPDEAPPDWSTLDRLFAGDPYASPHTKQIGRRRLYRRIARRKLKAYRRTARSLVAPVARNRERVSTIYDDQYAPSNDEFVRSRAKRRDAFLLNRRAVWGNGWYSIEFRESMIEQIVALTGARRVLEVGSGRGVNLALLALRRPDLVLEGIELTAAGVARSRELQERLPSELLALYGLEQLSAEQRAAVDRLRFVEADATAMPYDDDAFDLAFTYLVLEQIPDRYPAVVREMARVSSGYCAFVEPFGDANGRLGRAQLRGLDYFRASSDEMRRYGLEPVHFTTAFPQKVHFGTGLLVAKVRSP